MKGYPGVSINRVKDYQPRRGKYLGWDISYAYYKARIRINGKHVFLGNFDTPEAAAQAYRKAKIKRIKMIDLAPANDRGFLKGKFQDFYGEECSIQKSSLATEDCIWLGCDHETVDKKGRRCGARMHLTQQMAADLIPLLQHFVETGELPSNG